MMRSTLNTTHESAVIGGEDGEGGAVVSVDPTQQRTPRPPLLSFDELDGVEGDGRFHYRVRTSLPPHVSSSSLCRPRIAAAVGCSGGPMGARYAAGTLAATRPDLC